MGLWNYLTGKYPIEDMRALKTACEQSAGQIEKIKYSIEFMDKFKFTFDTIAAVEKNLKGVAGALGKVDTAYGAYEAYKRVAAAHKILSSPYAISSNTPEAVAAMATLINEFGGIVELTPGLPGRYGTALKKIASQIEPTVRMIVPQMRANQAHIWKELGFSISAG